MVHASCVALDGRGLLILGPSGSGKSRLALELIALGARLVSDDRTALRREDATLRATAPAALRGLIEARGVGLLRVPVVHEATVTLAVDLGQTETDRLPPRRRWRLLGVAVPLILGGDSARAAVLTVALRHGPPLDPDDDSGD